MKTLSLALLAAVSFAFTSCTKEYTCECINTTTVGTLSNTTKSTSTIKANLAKATTQCNESDQAPTTANGITSERDCSIK